MDPISSCRAPTSSLTTLVHHNKNLLFLNRNGYHGHGGEWQRATSLDEQADVTAPCRHASPPIAPALSYIIIRISCFLLEMVPTRPSWMSRATSLHPD